MSNTGGFVPIEDLQDGLKLLRDACKLRASVTLWLKDQGVVSHTRLSDFDFNANSFSAEIAEEMDLSRFIDGMSLNPFVYLNSSVHGQGLFFKAGFKEIVLEAGRLVMHFPEAVFRAQLRKHPRAVVSHRKDLQLFHPDPADSNRVLARRVYDLSVAGASAILFYGEERHYHVRQRIEGIELQLGSHSIKTWGIVRHLKVFPPDSGVQGVQLGMEFFNLGSLDQAKISELVQAEIRSQFSNVDI